MFDILDTLNEWIGQQRHIALATVVQTWGSSPRKAGAKMGISVDMAMTGSVSGGCVEAAVVEEALASLQDGRPRLLHFSVSDDKAWNVGLACGGSMSVFVEPLDSGWWARAADITRQNQPAVSITIVEGELAGEKMLLSDETLLYCTPRLAALADEQKSVLLSYAKEALVGHECSQKTVSGWRVLFEPHLPRPRLIIIGGAHVAMALQSIAHTVGFQVVIVDPRKAFATPERFPDVEAIVHSYPDRALPALSLDAESYVVVLTHDPKIDDPALLAALASPASYVGVMSSRRTHTDRIQRLQKAGLSAEQIARIRAPVGLDIGARTPEEIAVCIMAEIIAVRNGKLT